MAMFTSLRGSLTVAVCVAAIACTALTSSAQLQWQPQATIDGSPVLRGLPKDAIPAIDDPTFVPAQRATFVAAEEPVVGVVIDSQARAYPTWLLNGHEIVNDQIGGTAFAVTW